MSEEPSGEKQVDSAQETTEQGQAPLDPEQGKDEGTAAEGGGEGGGSEAVTGDTSGKEEGGTATDAAAEASEGVEGRAGEAAVEEGKGKEEEGEGQQEKGEGEVKDEGITNELGEQPATEQEQADGEQIQEDKTKQTADEEPPESKELEGEGEGEMTADDQPPPAADEDDQPLPPAPLPDGETQDTVLDEGGGFLLREEGEEEEEDGGVVTIDGIPVLQDIVEEEAEEEEVEIAGESREELMEQIMEALEEKSRLECTSEQIQSDIAEYLARKKDDEKADPGRTIIDHEKKYFQTMTILEGLHEELDTIKKKNQQEERKWIDLRDRKLEELSQAKADFTKFRKEKVLNVVDPRTGRKMTARQLGEYQTLEEKKEKDIIQVRLESIKLQGKITKLETMIKQKEQLVGGLHLIDFEQLKINNVDLNEKIEERNDDILKLKKKVTSTVEVLTHVKEKLQFLQAENAQKKDELREIEAIVAKKRDHLTRIKRTRDALRSDNLRLRQKGGLVGHTALLRDFEEKQDQSEEMYKRLETLQRRQAELSIMCEGLKKKIEQAKFVRNQV